MLVTRKRGKDYLKKIEKQTTENNKVGIFEQEHEEKNGSVTIRFQDLVNWTLTDNYKNIPTQIIF